MQSDFKNTTGCERVEKWGMYQQLNFTDEITLEYLVDSEWPWINCSSSCGDHLIALQVWSVTCRGNIAVPNVLQKSFKFNQRIPWMFPPARCRITKLQYKKVWMSAFDSRTPTRRQESSRACCASRLESPSHSCNASCDVKLFAYRWKHVVAGRRKHVILNYIIFIAYQVCWAPTKELRKTLGRLQECMTLKVD